MPKMKTHSGAKKRFKVTGSGKLKRRQANRAHILEKKASKRKRRLKGDKILSERDSSAVKRQLGI